MPQDIIPPQQNAQANTAPADALPQAVPTAPMTAPVPMTFTPPPQFYPPVHKRRSPWLIALAVGLGVISLGSSILFFVGASGSSSDANSLFGKLAQQLGLLSKPQEVKPQIIQVPGQIGPRGLQGTQGVAGTPGVRGASGRTGSTGADGIPGNPGATGLQGPQGPSGTATCPLGPCVSLQASNPGFAEAGNINVTGAVTAAFLNGDGSGLTNLDATQLVGTLNDSQLSGNVALKNGVNIFQTATDGVSGFVVKTSTGTTVLNVDTLNTRVGIGTAVPSQRLSVSGATSITNSQATSPGGTLQISTTDVATTGTTVTGISNTLTNTPTVTPNVLVGGATTVQDATALANTLQGLNVTVKDTGSGSKTLRGLFVDTSLTTNASAAVTTALFKTANSATAFQVQNASAVNALAIDTTSNTTTVANLTVTGTCTGCVSSGVNLQNGYAASTGGTTPEIKLDATRLGVDIQDADTTIGTTNPLFAVRGSNASGLGAALFTVTANNGSSTAIAAQPGTDSTSAIQFRTAGAVNLLDIDTVNQRIGVLTASPQTKLDVRGNTQIVNTATTSATPNLSVQTTAVPTTGGTQTGLQSVFTNNPTVTANTAVANVTTLTDATTLTNTLQGYNLVVSDTGSGAKTVRGLFVDTSGTTNASATVTTALFKSKNSASAFIVQDQSGAAALTIDTTSLTVTVSKLVTTNITVNGHIITGGSAPGIAAGAAACTSPTVSISSGNDTSGIITVTTGTGCASNGVLATITFATAFGSAPRVVLSPAGPNATTLQYYQGTANTTSFQLSTNNTPANSTTYTYNYWVTQ